MIELTPEQQQILDASNGSPPIVIDPRTAKTYVLVPKAPEPVDFEIPEGIRRSRSCAASRFAGIAGALPKPWQTGLLCARGTRRDKP